MIRARAAANAVTTLLWRRLDVPGHDACRLVKDDDGFHVEGATVFRSDDGAEVPTVVTYHVAFDSEWRTREGRANGWAGERSFDWHVERSADGRWTLNGKALSGLDGLVDLDLGVTPATNLSQLRRMALGVGRSAEVPVAWLDPFTGVTERLEQRYERRSETRYWYEAPRFAYAAELEVRPDGFVRLYPGLWQAEA